MKKKITLTVGTLGVILVAYTYYFFQREIPHFRPVVENVLYRSGQPRRLGLFYIKAKGIKTVVNLRSATAGGVQEEIDFTKAHHMRHYTLRMGTSPSEINRTAELFMKIMNDPDNLPVLVHCSRGKERSGIMSAVYLINKKMMDNKLALEETFRLGLTPGRMTKAEDFLINYNKANYQFEDRRQNSLNWLE